MTDRSPTRRTVLRAGGATLGTLALAGCIGPLGDDGSTNTPSSPIETVPAGARVVVSADTNALLDDQALRDHLNETLSQSDMGSADVDTLLSQFESEWGLDPEGLETLTAFGGYEADAPMGVRFAADWSESAVRDALADGTDPTSDTYADRTVYDFEDSSLGVLSGGSYVAGTSAGVEAAIDRETGDVGAVGGSVRDGFAAAPGGAIRFAFATPDDLGEGGGSGSNSLIDPSVVGSISHGYGGYASDGEGSRGSVTLVAGSADDATALAGALEVAREQLRGELDDRMALGGGTAESYTEMLDSLEIETDGTDVTLSVDDGEAMVLLFGAVLGTFVLGLGSSAPVAPQAAFEFDYDADADLLTVTHMGGDALPTDELSVRGENFADVADADLTGNGQWNGDASGSVEGTPAVVAGDSLTIGVESDYVCRMIWEDAEEGTAATLAVDQGPDAPDGPTEPTEAEEGTPAPQPPTVAFSFDFDADAGTLTIAHSSGDTVRADGLFVRGEGFADAADAELTAAGPWAGSTSGEVAGEPVVMAGDTVTVGVTDAYEIRLVWEWPDGGTSTTLAMDEGPGA